jgi:hypothetical protein
MRATGRGIAAALLGALVLPGAASGAVKHVGAVSWSMPDQAHPTQAADATDWDIARDSGADHGRLNVSWLAVDGTIEGEPDSSALEDRAECTTPLYRWCRLDRAVLGYAGIGQRVNPVLIGSPEWANSPGCTAHWNANACNPQRRYRNRWADFVQAAVERYGPGGIFPEPYQMRTWEVWNEPNLESFWDGNGADNPRRDARQYAGLVETTRAAVPSIRLAGPSVSTLAGNWRWLRTFAHKPAADALDVVSGHLYAPTPHKMVQGITRYRQALPRRPLWITENGFGSGFEHTGSELAQYGAFKRLMQKLDRRPYVKSLTWFAGARHTSFGGTHGLYRDDGTPKPVVALFSEAARAR